MSCCGFTSDGGGFGGGGGGGGGSDNPFAFPEQWAQENVPANQAATALSAQVSANFDNILAIRAGSLVGLRVRFTTPIAAGEATITVTINGGATALVLVCNAGSNPSGGAATAAIAAIAYVAGDAIGITIATTAPFAPDGGTTVEAWIEGYEELL